MSNSRHRVIVVLAIVALLVAPVGTVLGQQSGPTTQAPTNGGQNQNQTQNQTTGTTTAEPNAGAAGGTNGGSGGGGGGGVLGGFSLYEPKHPACQDRGSAAGFVCDAVVPNALAFGEGLQQYYVEIKSGVIKFLVERPRALQNGEISFFGAPTNVPMDVVHKYWASKTLPAALSLWALFMVLNLFTGLLPFGGASKYAQARALERGMLCLLGIIGSWGLGQLVLHGSFALSATLAPSAETLSTDPQVAQADTMAAVIGALILYLGYGVVAIISVVQFVLTWLGLYILLPALPLAVELMHPQWGPLRKLNKYGEKVFDLFLPCALWPVPAAVVLGVGYPISAGIAESMPDFLAFIPGINATTAGLLGILHLAVWTVAVIAPFFVFFFTSPSKTAASLALGALGGYSAGAASGASSGAAAGSAAGSASALPAGAAGSTARAAGSAASTTRNIGANPLSPSSLSAGTASPSASSLPSGSDAPTTAGTSTMSSAASSTAAPTTPAGTSQTELPPGGEEPSETSTSESSSTSVTDSGPAVSGAPGVTHVQDRATFDGDRSYEIGTLRDDGSWKQIAPDPMRGSSLVDDGNARRLADGVHMEDENELVLREPESGELMDVSEIANRDEHRDAQLPADVQNKQSRDVVHGTRDTSY